MTDTPPSAKPLRADARVRRIHWDALAAIIAALIGLLALGVSGYTAYIQRQQVRAQVWPYLMWASSDTLTQYMWMNKGVGPALVETTQVLVNGQPQRNWSAVMQAMQLDKLPYGQSSFSHSVLSAGDRLEWLTFANHADFQRFRDAAKRTGLSFKVCYCSTLGDCWAIDTSADRDHLRNQVGQCRAVPDARQFHD